MPPQPLITAKIYNLLYQSYAQVTDQRRQDREYARDNQLQCELKESRIIHRPTQHEKDELSKQLVEAETRYQQALLEEITWLKLEKWLQ
jgi:hypothetical protein